MPRNGFAEHERGKPSRSPDRGVTVAVLAPPRRGIDALIAAGLVSAPELPGGVAALSPPITLGDGPSMSEILDEVRRDEH